MAYENPQEILDFYQVEAYNGLSQEQVKRAVQQYGKNQLVARTKPHWLRTYFGQFKEFTTQVLAATAHFKFLIQDIYLMDLSWDRFY